ncbi:hypothetical protein [Nitrosomonas marina]|uniref:hypothetical protein n=1 Tax=Nitrosomonas marina TaxID=917 RepID=UPI001FE175EC|nr:hypothetical protein [Nitrosomonas marina]
MFFYGGRAFLDKNFIARFLQRKDLPVDQLIAGGRANIAQTFHAVPFPRVTISVFDEKYCPVFLPRSIRQKGSFLSDAALPKIPFLNPL